MAEWRSGGMAEWRNDGMAEWRNGWSNGGYGGNGGMAKRMAEWQNGRKWIHSYTYVLFTVHADDDDDTDDSLIFYSIEYTGVHVFVHVS